MSVDTSKVVKEEVGQEPMCIAKAESVELVPYIGSEVAPTPSPAPGDVGFGWWASFLSGKCSMGAHQREESPHVEPLSSRVKGMSNRIKANEKNNVDSINAKQKKKKSKKSKKEKNDKKEKKGANAIVKKKTKTANASDDGVKKQADTKELKMEKNNMYSS